MENSTCNRVEGEVTAIVIECPGRWEDTIFEAVQINVEGLKTPLVMTMALPRVSCHALSEFVDPGDLYRAIADAINKARSPVTVALTRAKVVSSKALHSGEKAA